MEDKGERPFPYGNIVDLPHYVSKSHPRMSMRDRAAQFSPFAALTGYEEAVEETARQTTEQIEPDEDQKEIINQTLQIIQERMAEHPVIKVTYFEADQKKEGGQYVTRSAQVKKLDIYRRNLILQNGIVIDINDILELDITDR